MAVVPVFVYSLIEERGKSGVVMRGRPVDGAGEPGAEVDIPAGDWRRMRFPMASREHPHDTFWNGSRQLAYVEIKADPERLRAGMAPITRAPRQRNTCPPNRGRREKPVWALVEPAARKWLEEYGTPIPGDGTLAAFELHLTELLTRHKERAGATTITRHAKKFIAAFEQQQRRGP
jgi:hypothetical protein